MNITSTRAAAEILAQAKKGKTILLTHKNPDGDAIGSSMAFHLFLKKNGVDSTLVVPNRIPDFLHWMPHYEDILIYEKAPTEVGPLLTDATTIICLDLNNPSRIGDIHKYYIPSQATKVIIDHHPSPDEDAELYYWDDKASSTAEMVFDFMRDVDGLKHLDQDIAYCIYTGIVTDTGSFQFPATSKNVHEIAGMLLDTGIDFPKVHREVYQSFAENRVRFFGYCMSKKMKIYPEYKAATIVISRSDLAQFKVANSDLEGLVNQPLQIGGINLAVLIVDRSDLRKFSFRSKGNMNVNLMARKYFGGGGHKNAAGGHSYKTLKQNIDLFEQILPEFKDEIINAI